MLLGRDRYVWREARCGRFTLLSICCADPEIISSLWHLVSTDTVLGLIVAAVLWDLLNFFVAVDLLREPLQPLQSQGVTTGYLPVTAK